MSKTEPKAVLYRTLDILRARGWAAVWSSDEGGPLNIRSAVAAACTDLAGVGVGREWYDLYLSACHAIGQHLRNGIIDWESKVKNPAEVEAMLAEVLQRMEKGEIKPKRRVRQSERPGGNSMV